MGGLGPGHKSDPPALKLRRGMGGTGGEDGRAGTWAQIGPACAKATARHGRNGGRGWAGWDPPALKLRRGMGGTGGEDGRAGSGAQIGEGEAGATGQYKESAGGEKERTAAMAERTGVADHRATGVAVVGGNKWRVGEQWR